MLSEVERAGYVDTKRAHQRAVLLSGHYKHLAKQHRRSGCMSRMAYFKEVQFTLYLLPVPTCIVTTVQKKYSIYSFGAGANGK